MELLAVLLISILPVQLILFISTYYERRRLQSMLRWTIAALGKRK